jgi:hypothetical protein
MLHLVVEAALGILGIVALAGCLFAWRLAQGPIDITALAQREQHYLTGDGATLSIGSAALAWEGFVDPGSAIDIRWRDVTVSAQDGTLLARLPQGRVTLSPARLAFGQIAPRIVEIDQPVIALLRRADGSVALDLGQADTKAASARQASDATPGPASPGDGSPGDGSQRLLRDLTRTGGGGSLPFLSQLRSIRIRQAAITVRDDVLGALWQAKSASIDLQRGSDNGITGQAVLDLQAGAVHATLTAHAELTQNGTHITAQATPVSPAQLARAMPAMAQAASLDAPVRGTLEATLDQDFTVRRATLSLDAAAGTLLAGKGRLALHDASLVLVLRENAVSVQSLRIAPMPAPNGHGPPPVLTGSGTATRANGRMKADFTLAIDHAAFADLAAYWPAGAGAGARDWITGNITAGTAQNARITGTVEAAADLSGAALTAVSGGLTATGLAVTWLKPVPGMTGGTAKLTLQGPDSLLIEVPQASQSVPAPDDGQAGTLAISNGRILITGLSARDQTAQIDLNATGALPDVLRLLNHKRLNLLSRRPIAMQDPAGSAAMTLSVHLPLDDRVTFDDIVIKGHAHLAAVHLGKIAAGRDLDQGVLDLDVDPNALKVTGTGNVADIPSKLGVDMDFRDGPPEQILEHYTASGRASPAGLEKAGLPGGIMTGGSAGVDVDYADRRDGSGNVAIDLDLRDAAIMTPLGWSKAAGPGASASARLGLTGGSITSIDRLRANGPGLVVASHAQLRDGESTVLQLDQVILGRTQAKGSIALPHGGNTKLRVMLRGPTLDISAFLKKRGGNRADDDAKPGQSWIADLIFDQVILAKDETLAPVNLQAESDGLHIARADVKAGAHGEISATIAPARGGRTLSVNSADSGAVLLAAGIADNIRGGKLRVDGFYDDTQPHSPLQGTATLTQFRITDAPAIGRLLKAMTLYGAVDLLNGPGLGFAQAVAPFRYQQQVLQLNGARAFSASLGITAQGKIDLLAHSADITGTIVPAYFFNQLPGMIPILGKLFSPEKGGGVFAARYSVTGPLADPKVGVNPLSALTPGFLRGIFGLFSSGRK